MISDTARYHGSFLALLIDKLEGPVSIEKLRGVGSGQYLIDRRIPVSLKMSSKRKGPWTFNFMRAHQEAHERLFDEYGELFVCLVCGRDGVAGLSMQEMRTVLDNNFEEQESISVRRRLKTMYQVVGRDGELRGRVSRQAVFEKIQATLARGM